MVRKFGLALSCVCALMAAGCGGGGNVVEDASDADVQSYEEMLAQEEAAGSANADK
ncbi:hypothetical protein [Rhodopirellula sp. MGV]|uniref:hypothetical protein n=1 Tax=Rhodopirellula sp. MGV TaxID=2023130 RepID=UPI0013043AD9|nr:hypothetical protein [Rhodopirellula sp. MGV]